ncbi:cell growth regulator with EF hand domain protein 1 [Colius striatus]|uniref:cell growth regulator with EF hand domain protein 1 n=1 Tax=Colius striatus TaxID=57412 RepID=UPI002B1D7577|nr:cell growth regulator with EF hand domain protein 1 [Colius striatus]
MAMRFDPDLDPLSPELLTLPLLQSTVRRLGPPERDMEAMTWEQALLYLFALHDYDRSGRLDGLELLQLLGTVLAQRDEGRLPPEAVAALVDQALERQDLSRDGLLELAELLLLPGWGPLGQPLRQQHGEPLSGTGAALGGDREVPGGDTGVHVPAEGQAAPEAEDPNAGAMEAEEDLKAEAPEAKSPATGATEAEEGPEAEALEDLNAGAPEGDSGEG